MNILKSKYQQGNGFHYGNEFHLYDEFNQYDEFPLGKILFEVNHYNQAIHLMKLMSDECNENNQFHQIDYAHQIL